LIGKKSNNHEKEFACDHENCGKTFQFKSELNRHLIVHKENRSYACTQKDCKKSFKRRDALENHKRLHSGITPYQCHHQDCKKKFPTQAGLRYHLLKHKNDKQYKCSFHGCNKVFLTKFQLDQHNRSKNIHYKMKTTGPTGIRKKKLFTEMLKLGIETSSMATNPTEDIKVTTMPNFNTSDHSRLLNICCQDEEALRELYSILEENRMLKKRLEISQKLITQIMERAKNESDQFSSTNS
jgi:hypothetical protein